MHRNDGAFNDGTGDDDRTDNYNRATDHDHNRASHHDTAGCAGNAPTRHVRGFRT